MPTSKATVVLGIAHELFEQMPDWVIFFREVLGVDGIVRRTFDEPQKLAKFYQTGEYGEIRRMLKDLRDRAGTSPEPDPEHVITVRLPRSLHEALREEARDQRISMNRLCISKLLQIIDGMPPQGLPDQRK